MSRTNSNADKDLDDKAETNVQVFPFASEDGTPPAAAYTQNLKRQMNDRHITFISIAGIIGTGLFLGSGSALKNGGPVGMLLGYSIIGSLVFSIMMCLGEMISYLPIEGGHIALAHRFGKPILPNWRCYADPAVDPAWGTALSFNYAFFWLIILPAELSASAVLINYWNTTISNGVWITMCLVVIIIINVFGARGYAEAESIFASIKILTIVGCIIMSIAIDCGAGPAHQGYLGFRYWRDPGPFTQYQGIGGATGRFLSFWAVLTQAAFSFGGTEVLAIAAGETKNPRRTLSSAIRKVWIRIVIFYVGSVFVMGLTVPSTNDRLGTASNASASPFVIAAELAGIKSLPSIINACILSSAWSASSADLYTSSRSVYAIALNGDLPKVFLRVTKSGLPYVSVAVSACFGLLAFMCIKDSSATVFGWFANLTSIGGLMTWLAIAVTYLRFRAGMEAQGIDRSVLPFRSRFAKFGAYYSIGLILVVSFFSAWTVFIPGNWSTSNFVTNYLPLVLFPVMFLAKKLIGKTQWRKAHEMDFTTGLTEILDSEIVHDSEAPRIVWKRVVNFFV